MTLKLLHLGQPNLLFLVLKISIGLSEGCRKKEIKSNYQNLKKTYSFEDLCKTPKLSAETAIGPIADFDFDVAILFSDILFPLESLGMNLSYDPQNNYQTSHFSP